MSPMGFAVHRQTYADDIEYDEYYMPAEDQTTKPVPIWLCVFLVVSYILGGAVLFNEWESWIFLDSAYFCFITLTTIGKYITILMSVYIFIYSLTAFSLV